MTAHLADLLGSHWNMLAAVGVVWLALVGAILAAWSRRPRERDICDRCGGEWKRTGRGGAYHFCSPPWRRTAP